MRDSVSAPSGALLEHDDTVVIMCPWRHAGFLWSQLLTKRRLHYDREYDPESLMLFAATHVNLAREIGADWMRQLYLEPNPA